MLFRSELKSVTLEESIVDPSDIEMLQDLIVLAVNSALKAAEDEAQESMSKMTGGMNIPGM